MEIVPIVHVRDGLPMQGRPGAWEPMPTPYPDHGDDPKGFLRHLYVRFGRVMIVDLGEGRSKDAHHNMVQRLARQHVPVWMDAGAETLEDIMDLFVAGADRVTVRMDEADLDDLEEVLDIAEGEIWLGYPFEDDNDLARLVRDAAPDRFLDQGAAGIVLIDLGAAGRRSGVDPSAVRHFDHRDEPVFYAGGVRDARDVDALEDVGADGVGVGTALLEDLDAWAKLARAHKEADETGPGEEDEAARADEAGSSAHVEVSAPGRRSFLPGVVPSRGGIEYEVDVDEDDEEDEDEDKGEDRRR